MVSDACEMAVRNRWRGFAFGIRLLMPESFARPVWVNVLLTSGLGLCVTLPIGPIAMLIFNSHFDNMRTILVLAVNAVCIVVVVKYFHLGSALQFGSAFVMVQIVAIGAMITLRRFGYRLIAKTAG